MSCGRIRRLFSVYMDEQTTERERLRVGLHLTHCRDCRKRLEELRSFRLALQASPRAVVPAEFSAGWRFRLRQEAMMPQAKPGMDWSRRVLILAPAAACILLVATGFAILLPRLSGRGVVPVPSRKMQAVQPRTLAAERSPQTAGAPESKQPSLVPGPSVDWTGQAPAAAPTDDAAGPALDQGGGYSATNDYRNTPVPPGSMAASAGESAARSGSGSAALGANKTMLERPVPITGSWRVWLTSVGPRPAAIKRVLVEKGLLRRADNSTALDAPFLLCQGLAYSEAQDLAQRLQEAGARTIVELMPR